MRNYGVVYCLFWTSETIKPLSVHAKILAIYLLTGPHACMIGCFRLPHGYAKEDLGWNDATLRKAFQELSASGFTTHDPISTWIFVNSFQKWNKIENQNQAVAAIKLAMLVPDGFSAKSLLFSALHQQMARLDMAKKDKVWNAFETVWQTLSESGTGTGAATAEHPPSQGEAINRELS